MIDSGLALIKPHSEVRRRLYLMFAILESTPEYWKYFIPVRRSGWYIITIIGVGLRSVLRAIFGVILVKAL